ncbi:transcriptional regulator [Ectothiorhodospiraceae bacterium 2226]|nr:transcriptional regulator [Ectothiorhodospiraceae bacterium 2226]
MDSEELVRQADLPLNRDAFMRQLIRILSGALEDVVGLQEARGFITLVGQEMGEQLDADYRRALSLPRLEREQVAAVLVDLKRRIKGDFYIISQDDEKIVLGNRACPFADEVQDRESLCMMTSNVFGTIAAENLGYAKVVLDETIARRDPECRVVLYLTPSAEATAAPGDEYFQS